jgi:hypothetical protein
MMRRPLLTSFSTSEKERGMERGEREREREKWKIGEIP